MLTLKGGCDIMGLPNNILSEKTKARIVDDCVRLSKTVVSVLLDEVSRILGEYSRTMSTKPSAACCEKLTIKENEAE